MPIQFIEHLRKLLDLISYACCLYDFFYCVQAMITQITNVRQYYYNVQIQRYGTANGTFKELLIS